MEHYRLCSPYPRHVIGPLLLCKHTHNTCPRGSGCPNAHSEAELESWHAQRDPMSMAMPPSHARSFLRG